MEELLDVLVAAAQGGADGRNGSTQKYIREIREKLSTDDLYLAVLGLFKRGKSTLINALLGCDVLPAGIVPLTSVITKIRYGDSLGATISFDTGAAREVAVSDISEYITEKGNPRNAKGVLEAEVRVPSPLLKVGLTVIDTPGVGSTFRSGTETTYGFLERVDACLFVLAVDPPISEEELDLLNATKQYAKNLTFVLNKKDYVDEVDLNEAIRFCKGVVESYLDLESVTISPLSAKLALEGHLEGNQAKVANSGITQLTTALEELLKRKQEILIASAAAKALKAAASLSLSQEIAIRSASMPLGELERALSELEHFLTSVESKKREIFYLLDGKTKEIVQALDDDIARFKNERGPGFVAELQSCANQLLQSRMSSMDIVDALESRMKEALIKTYSDFISSEDRKIESSFRRLAAESGRHAESLLAHARLEMARLFRISVEAPVSNLSLTTEHRLRYFVDPLFSPDLMFVRQIPLILPRSMLKGSLLKRVKELAEDTFDRTAGRVRYDYFIIRLDKGKVDLKRELGQLLDSFTIAAREAALEGSDVRLKSREEMEKTLGLLNDKLTTIESVKNRLEELANADREAR